MDLFNLQDKVIILTGGLGLIGSKYTEALLSYGANVVLIDIKEDEWLSSKLHLEKFKKFSNQRLDYFNSNITNENTVESVYNKVMESYGKIDVLINNACNNPKLDNNHSLEANNRLETMKIETWSSDLNVGLTGAFICTRVFSKGLKKGKNPLVINISSDLGLIAPDQSLYNSEDTPFEYMAVKPVTYSIIKSALIGFTKYLSTYWIKDKNIIRSIALVPGGVKNNQNKEFIDKVNNKIPLGSLANPEDYQSTIVYLCSDYSNYLNGSILTIDGGRTAW
ncbi:SDR family oxidoreductase [Staphylococcus saprophyticus]